MKISVRTYIILILLIIAATLTCLTASFSGFSHKAQFLLLAIIDSSFVWISKAKFIIFEVASFALRSWAARRIYHFPIII